MSFFDQNEHHIAAAASAAVSSVTTAAPLFGRSLSAPHLQLSNMPQDFFMHGRSPVHNMGQDLMLHSHISAPYNECLPHSLQHFVPHSFGQSPYSQVSSASTLQYTTCPPGYNQPMQPTTTSTSTQGHDGRNTNAFGYQHPIHPFQMDQLTSSISNLETATGTKMKVEYPNEVPVQHPGLLQSMEDVQSSDSSLSCSPTTPPADNSRPPVGHPLETSSAPFRPARGYSDPLFDSGLSRFDVPDEYHPAYLLTRHGSLGSLYPLTHSHELLEPTHSPGSSSIESAPMLATASSTSITSVASMASNTSNSSSSSGSSPPSASARARRRASLNPDSSSRVFTCSIEQCGKLFRRSEHLKRHFRSVHTLEKPFECPITSCPKRFSRSDNLNQHIRIHRHDKEKSHSKPFTNFTPFLSPLGIEQD